ncbi:hypothetical protein CYY_000678 [Polysphondylium violaceum]|uniref:Peptidase A22B family protein n=1 Tax=Polysphondylium violaceum TaxID=133409 RepID=A0A8J4Q3G9_9MYCE|nr:hypothetical protein CYY_000678 [Polysphondylium violaceum]
MEAQAAPAPTPTPTLELTPGLMIAYASIWLMAVVPIYVGSKLSLKETKVSEKMSSKDAWLFPVYGSAFLFGLYLLFKFFDKDLINLILSFYFLLLGILAMTQLLGLLLRKVVGSESNSKKKTSNKGLFTLKVPKFLQFIVDKEQISPDLVDIVSLAICTGFGVWYMQTKHWIANNILGLTFSIQGISLLSLTEYKVGVILLSGLFFYDIFWVFGTDVMVTVAKSFDAPIKLLFPKDIFADVFQFSMLGLGDIVLPGIFIALLIRFDRYLHLEKTKGARSNVPMKTPYFTSTMIAYGLGLATTFFVMHTFRAAQPALLYLVPFCVGSSMLMALSRGEFKKLFNSDLSEETQETKVKGQ